MASRKPKTAGRPKDLDKRDAIMCAAGDCFLKLGFEGASMDAIAEAAGVSKLTVYSHFHNKDVLFKEVIRHECELHDNGPEAFEKLSTLAPRSALLKLAKSFMGLVLNPRAVAMHRIITAEAVKRPKISQLFYEAGPERVCEQFVVLLKQWEKPHKLNFGNYERAAFHFFCMLKGEWHMRVLLNIKPMPTQSQIDAHIREVVDLFLKAYRK